MRSEGRGFGVGSGTGGERPPLKPPRLPLKNHAYFRVNLRTTEASASAPVTSLAGDLRTVREQRTSPRSGAHAREATDRKGTRSQALCDSPAGTVLGDGVSWTAEWGRLP